MRKFPLCAVPLAAALILALPAVQLRASDFGVIFTQDVSTDDAFSGEPNTVTYRGIVTPWFHSSLEGDGDVYLSFGVGPLYEDGDLKYVGEMLRSEVTVRNGRGTEFEFGRMPYTDPLGLIAGGMFDGFKLSQEIGEGTLSFGVWYTGLLYKKSANITVSPEDHASYYTRLDTKDMNTYFGSRRMLAAIEYDNSALAEILWLKLAFMGQFDMNDRYDKYNSEYLTGKLTIPFKNTFFLNAGGSVELLQTPDKDAKVGVLGEAGASWVTPSSYNDRLSFSARYATGRVKDTPVGGFMPLTTEAQGGVLKAKMSGLAALKLDYLMRVHETVSMDFAFSYFLKTVKGSYGSWPVVNTLYGSVNENNFALGGEVFFSMNWVPTADIQLKFNSGVFIPAMGNVAPDERPHLLFNLGVSIAPF